MTISENRFLFIEPTSGVSPASNPVSGGNADCTTVGNSAFDGYFEGASSLDPAKGEITVYGNGEAVLASVNQRYSKNFNVTKPLFAGTAADLDNYLQGTKLAGQGAALLDAQNKYGVNALFLMAIIETESGYGNAPARDKQGIKPYNVAGLKKRGGGYQNNPSYAACIDSLGSSLSRLYLKNGRVTIEKIRQLYCPGNPSWSGEVIDEMQNISTNIRHKYGV